MLKQIHVQGFRLLRDFRADLTPVNIVIGANATGKSTLFDAIGLIRDLCYSPIQDAFAWHRATPSVAPRQSGPALSLAITFSCPKMETWDNSPIPKNRDFEYMVDFKFDSLGAAIPQLEILSNAEPYEGHDSKFKLLEARGLKCKVFDPRKRKLVDFDDKKDEPASKLPPTNTEGPKADQPRLRLAQMQFFNEFPEVSWIRALLASMAIHSAFDVRQYAEIRTQAAEIRPNAMLSSDGQNLAAVLHEVFTRHSNFAVAEEIQGYFRLAYPFVERLTAETTYGSPPRVQLVLKESGSPEPIFSPVMSDGMLRYLCLLVALLGPSYAPVVCLDEPEIGLHPRLLPIVADAIKLAGERRQVIVNTHSPDLLSCFSLQQVAVMTRNQSGAAWHRPSTKEGLKRLLDVVSDRQLGDLHRSGELEEDSE